MKKRGRYGNIIINEDYLINLDFDIDGKQPKYINSIKKDGKVYTLQFLDKLTKEY